MTAEDNAAVDDVVALFERLGWDRRQGASYEEIIGAEAELGVTFPDDLRALLLWSDGGEAFLGQTYMRLFSVAEIREHNSRAFEGFFPGLLRIGGNGGLEGYCLDYRSDPESPVFSSIDLNNSGPDSHRRLAGNLTDALERLSIVGDPWPRDP